MSIILVELINAFSDNPDFVRDVATVMKDTTNYNAHSAARQRIISQKLYNNDLVKKYMVEFHDFMYIIQNGEKVWKHPETSNIHCDVKRDGFTLPAIIGDSSKRWLIQGQLHNADKDKFGHTMPAEKRNNGATWWNFKHTVHRVDICNDPSLNDYGKVLPAYISTHGEKKYKYFNIEYPQEELTRLITTKYNVEVLDKLAVEFPLLVEQISNVKNDILNYNEHQNLKKLLDKDNSAALAYFDEFHNFMFEKQNNSRYWYKPGTQILHCTKTFINSEGLTETFPARIDCDNEHFWYEEGKIKRTDVDKFGNTLPNVVLLSHKRQKWMDANGNRHRMELCNDPSSKHFEKALPAFIDDGKESWFINGNMTTQKKLTKKLTKHIIRHVASYEAKIVNGEIQLIVRFAN
jgi:hypothetical protein